MGLLQTIRESYARAKRVAHLARAELETAARYQNMRRAEAAELPDELLLECVAFRLEREGVTEKPADAEYVRSHLEDYFDP